jgi:capsule polysaccharide export protein KpsE/RkpR
MGEPHVISALSNKRSELAGIVSQLERQLEQQQANLAPLDATMRRFDPDIRPNKIRPR